VTVSQSSLDRIERLELFQIFHLWLSSTNRRGSRITRNLFYKILREKGWPEIKSDGLRYFQNLCLIREAIDPGF
jgi:hypothetical protein